MATINYCNYEIKGTLDTNGAITAGGVITAPGGNSSQWNTGYANSVTGIAFSGTTTKTLTVTQQDGGTLTGTFTDLNYYTTAATFNTGNGIITFSGAGGQPGYTVDLDGRYALASVVSGVTSINFKTDGTALNVASNTITTSGTMTGVWQGTSSQYVNGQGDLITFPSVAGTYTFDLTGDSGTSATVTSGSTVSIIGSSTISTTSNGFNVSVEAITAAVVNGGAELASGDQIYDFVIGQLPSVSNNTITLSAGTGLTGGGNFTLNQSSNETITFNNSITNNNQLTNGAGYITSSSLQGVPAILSNGSTPSLNTGISAAEVRSLIGAGTSSSAGVTSVDTGSGLTGGTITGTGTVSVDYAGGDSLIMAAGNAFSPDADDFIIYGADSSGGGDTVKIQFTDVDVSLFNNDAGYTSNIGDITAVVAGTGMSGGGASGSVTLNCTVTGDTGVPAILSNGSTPSLNSGISAAEVRSLIGAGTSSSTGTVTSVTVSGSSGISGSGTVTTSGSIGLTNSDKGSSQNIFKNVLSDSGTAVADNNNDTLSIIGAGSVTTAVVGDVLTITGTDDNENYYVSGASQSGGTLTLTRNGLSTLTATGFTNASNTQTFTNKSGNISQWTNNSGYITSASLPTVNNATITIAAGNKLSGTAAFTTNQGSNETITLGLASNNISQFTNDSGYTGNVGDITGVTAGTNLTGGGTSGSVTLNMATGGAGAASYGSTSNSTKIDTITLDAYGRVTAVATGATGQVNTVVTGNSSTLTSSGTTAKTLTPVTAAVSSGSANLATGAQIQTAINTALVGVLSYQGTWNASTNSPTLSSGSGTAGYYYIVSVAGSTNLDGITDWAVGDWAVFSDQATDAWQKIDNTQVGNVTGSGSLGRVAYWNSSSNITSDAGLTFNGSTNALTVTGAVTWSGGGSTESNSAYDNMVTGFGNSGSSTKLLTLTQQDGGTLTTSFSIPQGTVTSVATAGSVSGLTLTGGTITTTGTVTLGGTLSLTSANVTTGLGFTPYNSTNPSGYTSYAEPGIFSGGGTPTLASGVTGAEIRTLIGAGTSSSAGVTSVATSAPITGGTITGSGTIGITQATTSASGYLTSTNWNTFNNKTSNLGTVTSVTVSGSSGISGSGTVTTSGSIALTNSDKGSSQSIFKNIAVSGQSTVVADSNNDTLTFAAAGGMTITTDAATDTITFNPNDDNSNYYVSGASYASGTLTLTRNGLSTLTATGFPTNNNQLSNGEGYTTNSGTVTSVNFKTDGTALNVVSNTITTSGTMTGVWQGTSVQYVNGLGDLTTFPSIPQGDITAVIAGTGLSGGGTSGSVTLNNTITNNNQLSNGAGYITIGSVAITSNGSTPSLGSGISAAEIRSLIGAGTSSTGGTVTSVATTSPILGGPFTNSGTISHATSGVTAATYTAATIAVNSYGHITSASSNSIPTNNNQLTNGAGYITSSSLPGSPGNGTLTVSAGANLSGGGTFTANQSGNTTISLAVTGITSDTGVPAILSNGSTPSLNSGITAVEIRSLIGAGVGDITGVTAGTGMSGGGSSGSVTLNCTITNNNQLGNGAGYIDIGDVAITSNGSTPSLGSGISAAEVRSLIGAASSSVITGVTSVATTSPILGGTITGSGTISHANSGVSAATYTAPTIVVNATGHITSASSNTIPTNNNQLTNGAGYITSSGAGMSNWTVRDDDNDDATISNAKYLKFVSATGTSGTNLSGAGSSGNPYVMTITSPNTQSSSGVTSIATTNGITGGTITSTGTLQVDSTVIRTTGNQTIGGNKTFTNDIIVGAGSSVILNDQPTASTSTGNGFVVNWSVSTSVTAGTAYVVKTDGGWTTTDADSEAKSTAMAAIALGSNATAGMLLQGFFYKASHGFAIGAPLFISNTAGALTNTRPSGNNDYVRIMGYATSTNYIYFDPDKTWVKVTT